MTMITTFTGGTSGRSISVVPDPFRDPFDAPFALLTRPPVGDCSGVPLPNRDGTPAHSSGVKDRAPSHGSAHHRRQPGGAA